MPLRRALLALFLCGAVAPAAEPEVHTLTGKDVKGELVGLDAKVVSVKRGEDVVKVPLKDVLDITLAPVGTLPNQKHYLVELSDDTQLRCKGFTARKRTVELELLAGGTLKVDLGLIRTILKDANDPKVLEEWRTKLARKDRPRDAAASMDGKVMQVLEGTFGDAADDGKSIAFTRPSGKVIDVYFDKVQALQFLRGPLQNAKPLLCRITDTKGNVLMAAAVAKDGENFTVTTVAGAKATLPEASVASLDFSRGKLLVLSDLDPAKVVYTNAKFGIPKYQRNRDNGGRPIRIGSREFRKGLWVHANTELQYDVGGDYREFKALVGLDDNNEATSPPVTVVIMGDGQELARVTLDRGDKKALKSKDLTVNIQKVSRLKIIVQTDREDSVLPTGRYVLLGDAKVLK